MTNGFICKTAGCKLCREYSRKRGCISKHCPYLAERVAAGALNYKSAVMEAFGSNPLFRDDLTAISRRLANSVWNGAGHKQRMEALRVYTGRDKSFYTNEYEDAVIDNLLSRDAYTAQKTRLVEQRDDAHRAEAETQAELFERTRDALSIWSDTGSMLIWRCYRMMR